MTLRIALETLKTHNHTQEWGFPGGAGVKNLTANAGNIRNTVRSLGQEDPLEEDMATHSSILAWRIPGTEEPGRLQSSGLQKLDMTKAC